MRNLIFAVLILISSNVFASGWSMNLGYNNPPGSSLGLDFMHLWSNWAFEIGIGNVDSSNNSSSIGGAINMKYLFSSGGFRPYLQAGTGYGFGTGNSTASVGIGGSVYAGAGFFAAGTKWYGYTSVNTATSSNSTFFQFGIGYNF